ncbi:MAG: CaiB/BaiF CoA transferase family protein [Cumulibacter sp.]
MPAHPSDIAGRARGPLDDLVVIDLTVARAGPTAVRYLADWGAHVIRIEPPAGSGGGLGDRASADYLNLHRSKSLMELDLKDEGDRARLYELTDAADIFVENNRAPVKFRLGVDYETLSARNPRLIYGSISGYGQRGPYSERGAVDQIIQGMGGLMSITGLPGAGPVRAGIAVSDLAAGHQLAIGLLIAVHERARSGKGQWVQVSLIEAMLAFLDFQAARWTVNGEVPTTEGNHHPTVTPMGTYTAADGHLNVAAMGDRLFGRLCDLLGPRVRADDQRFATSRQRYAHRDELNGLLDTLFAEHPRAYWIEKLNEVGVPCGPVLAMDEVFADPQVQHLGMLAQIDRPGGGSADVLRNSITMSRSQSVPPRMPPQQA